MKDYFTLFLIFAGMGGCAFLVKKCDDKLDAAVLKERMASGTTTWMFKTPAKDTIYSTQFKSWGQPKFGVVGNTGRGPQAWYFGDALIWEMALDDKFKVQVNPNCILIGSR